MTPSCRTLLPAPFFLALVAITSPARAETLYETAFEQPTFNPGILDGQGGFVAFASPDAAVISTTAQGAGDQSVEIRGGALEEFGGFFYGEYAVGIFFDTTTGPSVVEVMVDVRLDGAAATSPNLSINLGAYNFDEETLGDIFIDSTGTIVGLTDPFSGFGLATAGSLGGFTNLRMLIDFDARTTSFFVDGALLGILSIPAGVATDGLFYVSLAMVSIAPAGETAGYTGFVDNLNVTAVPEPSSLALSVLGGLGLIGLARWRRPR